MIALILGVAGQSVLLFDTLISLGDLDGTELVIVDDGGDRGMQFAGLGMAALYPGAHYLAGSGGAGAARNRGIEFVLATRPDVQAIGFLDADDMLSDWSLPHWRRLLEQHPEADWFYTDIDRFGLEATGDCAGAFSPLLECLVDVSAGGNLIRRRVFECGLRFAPTLPPEAAGWDFRLAAIEQGFRGLHMPGGGFRSRRRPTAAREPTHRDVARLEARHPWIGDLKWLVAAEHRTVPRYAIHLVDLDVVRLSSSAEATTEELPWEAYIGRFWAAAQSPRTTHVGAILLVTTSLALRVLESAGLLSWVLFDLEARLLESEIAAISLQRNADHRLKIAPPQAGSDRLAVLAGMSMTVLRRVAQDVSEAWLQSARTEQPVPRISGRRLHLSHLTPYVEPLGNMIGQLAEAGLQLRRSPFATTGLPAVADAAHGAPDRAALHRLLRARFAGGILPPALDRPGLEVAFVLPSPERNAISAAVLLAAALRRRGTVVSLVLLNVAEQKLSKPLEEAFDRLFFIDSEAFERWNGPAYLGTVLTGWSVSGEHAHQVNLLSIFEAVVACGAPDALGLMAVLQRRFVVTGAYVTAFDADETGRHGRDAHVALAFEDALDLLICGSEDIEAELHARGAPAAKLITVRPEDADAVGELDELMRRRAADRERGSGAYGPKE